MFSRIITGMVWMLAFSGLAGQPVLEIAAPGILNMPPVASNHNSISFQYNLRNVSTTPFSGTVHTMALVNGTLILPIDTLSISSLNPNQTSHITVPNFLVDDVTLPFVLGRNGIVIWVADDNFNPLTDSTTQEITLLDGPGFRLQSLSLPCPLSATPNERIDFSLLVLNEYAGQYKDILFLHAQANGKYLGSFTSADKVTVPGEGQFVFDLTGFKLAAGDFPVGNNDLRMWVTGLNGAISLDTLACTVKVLPESSTGIAEASSFSLHPNPSQGLFTISGTLPIGARMRLHDALGRTILDQDAQPAIDLRAFGIVPGTYWFELLDAGAGTRMTFKVVLLP